MPPGRLVLITCTDWDGLDYLSNTLVYADPAPAGHDNAPSPNLFRQSTAHQNAARCNSRARGSRSTSQLTKRPRAGMNSSAGLR